MDYSRDLSVRPAARAVDGGTGNSNTWQQHVTLARTTISLHRSLHRSAASRSERWGKYFRRTRVVGVSSAAALSTLLPRAEPRPVPFPLITPTPPTTPSARCPPWRPTVPLPPTRPSPPSPPVMAASSSMLSLCDSSPSSSSSSSSSSCGSSASASSSRPLLPRVAMPSSSSESESSESSITNGSTSVGSSWAESTACVRRGPRR
jgi:hypothetical protein